MASRRLPAIQQKLDPRCAICEEEKPLTDDHVFPKVAVDHLKVRISAIYPGPADAGAPTLSQNGVRFKTLCGDCNSELGNKYDPHLGDLVRQVRKWDASNLKVLDRIKVAVDVEAVILSIYGHLLAGSSIHPEISTDLKMRECLLKGHLLPDAPRVFYWWARYSYPTILRGILRARFGHVRGREHTTLSVFKVAPLGFLVADSDEYEDLPELDAAAREGALRLWPGIVRKADWPEAPDDDGFIMTGATASDGRIARPVS